MLPRAFEIPWELKSVGDICRQIKDPTRNGGRNLALLHEHIAKDDLVAWAWRLGMGRTPARGTRSSSELSSRPGSRPALNVREEM
jgi:hypothetical protein